MRNRRSTEFVAVVIAFAALVATFLTAFEFRPRVNRRLHAAIGEALARETLKLLGQGGQVTVIARDTETFKQPAMDVLLATFTREVRRAGAAMAATQLIQLDPLRPAEVPSGDFFELIRRAPAGQVIVSFLGPPLLAEEQRSRLGQIKPKIVAFCSGNLAEMVDLRQLFEAGLLHAAVVSRRLPSVATDKPRRISQDFDQLYLTMTAADLAKWPSPSGGAR